MSKYCFGKQKLSAASVADRQILAAVRASIGALAAARPGSMPEPMKSALARVARQVGLGAGRIAGLWYGKIDRPRAGEALVILRAAERLETEIGERELAAAASRAEYLAAVGPILARLAPPAGGEAEAGGAPPLGRRA